MSYQGRGYRNQNPYSESIRDDPISGMLIKLNDLEHKLHEAMIEIAELRSARHIAEAT